MGQSVSVPVSGNDPAEPLLPRELLFFYPVAPLLGAVLLLNDLFTRPWAESLPRVLSLLLPFGVLTSIFHPLYALVMPRLLRRVGSQLGRAALHLSVVSTVASVAGLALLPSYERLCGGQLAPLHFALLCVVISSLMLFPAMLVQGQRNRALRIERHAMNERQALLRAQLDALQARTNPHFFFNSINTVASLIGDDPVLAERTLERLSDLFRYALDSARVKSVPLRQEFAMVKDFLAIQQARFGERLSAEVALAQDVEAVEVPPLLLQPLVENAVLHGVGQRAGGHVTVKAWREGERVRIEVSDDGPGPGASPHRGSQTSVRDLGERLRLTFGEGAEVLLRAGPTGGCLASLSFAARPA
jgi:two-component system sensor histidine kinase AlgZ